MIKYFLKLTLCLSLFTCSLSKAQTTEFNQNLSVNKFILEVKTPPFDSIIGFMSLYHKALFSTEINTSNFYTKETIKN